MAIPPPDPAAKLLSSDKLAEDGEMPDDGPVLDTGPSEIDIERGNAGLGSDVRSAVPPEAELPPD